MIYLLDTNTCIRFLNGTSEPIRQRIQALTARDIALCSVVKSELVYGALKSKRPEANLSRLNLFFSRFVTNEQFQPEYKEAASINTVPPR